MIKTVKNIAGQSTLEFVLMFALIVGVFSVISRTLKSTAFFQKTYGDTWGRINNTIESGIPDPGPEVISHHPAGRDRHATKLPGDS